MTVQLEVSEDIHKVMAARNVKFLEKLNDPSEEPVNVFNPLRPQQLQELQLIREVSQELQAKKEEDMRRAAEAREKTTIVADETQKETDEEAAVQEPKQDA